MTDIRRAIGRPIVLHGGTGIPKSYIMDGIAHGIVKINIATAIRQPYERNVGESVERFGPAHRTRAQQAVYDEVVRLVREDFEIADSVDVIAPGEST